MTIPSSDEGDKQIERHTDTGGGTYIEGDVHIHDGDFVGGRSIVYHDRTPRRPHRRPGDLPRDPDAEDPLL